ncbi:MAG: glutamate decarboxylase [Thermoleophilia bacterium]|nr:glutamate decarboxylase [Thermoleophilia bacterium]
MAIHDVKKPEERGAPNDVYAPTDPSFSAPKYHMPDEPRDPRKTYLLVRDELLVEGNSRLNLATFCQTWVEPELRQLMAETYDKNMIDKDEYPQTAELEKRCVHMISELWNAQSSRNAVGTSTTGSSEASMLGGMALLWRWRERQRAAGRPTDKPNIVYGVNVQVCWHKFARYWGVEERLVPVAEGRYVIDPDQAARLCDENTICVVGILGSTFTGEYEPITGIAAALDRLEQETGIDVPIHVDAASGGFVAPFLHPDLAWDFRQPRVKSINASGHKYGLAPLGVGWVIWADAEELPEDLVFHVNYLGGDMPTFAINFSRPGGQVIAQYFNLIRLGREGYRQVQQYAQDVALFLADEIEKAGPFRILARGTDLPIVAWTIEDGANFTLFELADRLRERGWQLPAYTLPRDLEDVAICRIVVRHGMTMDLARLFLEHMGDVLERFAREPERTPSAILDGGFSHT